MTNLNAFDFYLNKVSALSANLKNTDHNIAIGSLSNNLKYKNNNPLEFTLCCKKAIGININFDDDRILNLQHIKKLPETPFYVSSLSDNEMTVKVIDYYDWQPNVIIYRIIILKNFYSSPESYIKINFNFKTDKIMESASNVLKVDDAYIHFSEKTELIKNQLISTISRNGIASFCMAFTFNKSIEVDLSFSSVKNKFNKLYNLCQEKHVNKLFSVKSRSAEIEMDDLWSKQKYMFPDRQIDTSLMKEFNDNPNAYIWVIEFFKYFGIKSFNNGENEVKQFNNNLTKQSNLDDCLDALIKKYKTNSNKYDCNLVEQNKQILSYDRLLKCYFSSEATDTILQNELQQWWDVFSLPVMSEVFILKLSNFPEEIFIVYFLAVRHNFPWAEILLDRIENTNINNRNRHQYNFLLLIAFFYHRISKWSVNQNEICFHPGYKWDNNHKALSGTSDIYYVKYTRYSKSIFTTLNKENIEIVRIDQPCNILVDNKLNVIRLTPNIFEMEKEGTALTSVDVKVDEYKLLLPLNWKKGEVQFLSLRLRWILKKNRFQLTFFSKSDKKVLLNNREIFLEKNRKTVHYQAVKYLSAKLNINIFNSEGRTYISKLNEQSTNVFVDGALTNNYGVFSDNLLYRISPHRKHKVESKSSTHLYGKISIPNDISEIEFFAKRLQQAKKLKFYDNFFIDKFVHYYSPQAAGSIIFVFDNQMTDDLVEAKNLFYKCFRFQPEFLINDKNIAFVDYPGLIIFMKKNINGIRNGRLYFKRKNYLVIETQHPVNAMINLLQYIGKNMIS